MVRKLKFHEKKLLKKVDFLNWKLDNNLHEIRIMKKYYIQRREDYTKYKQLSREIREIAHKIRDNLNVNDGFRVEATRLLLNKLYEMGLIPTKESLELASKVNASSFCRRRLPAILLRNGMAENMKTAVTWVEAGHVRIGPDTIMDPATLITRPMEDLITWTQTSAIKKHVLDYAQERDDYDLVN